MVTVTTFQTMDEAASALSDNSKYIAGGTLVMRAVNYGDQSFDNVVRVLQPDRAISSDGQGTRIGAGATMSDILANRDVDFLHPIARMIGGPAIRNMATIGGNLFAENPYGDMAAALLTLDAHVHTSAGQTLPMDRFLQDRDNFRGIVTSVVVPRVQSGSFAFRKVSRVKPKGVSVMTVSVLMRAGEPRVVFGNMGPTALRAPSAERALAQRLSQGAIEAACSACTDGLAPAEDSLASVWYRNEVAPVHLRRLLTEGGLR